MHIFAYNLVTVQMLLWPINKGMDNKEQNMAKLHNEEAHNKRY